MQTAVLCLSELAPSSMQMSGIPLAILLSRRILKQRSCNVCMCVLTEVKDSVLIEPPLDLHSHMTKQFVPLTVLIKKP